MYCKLFFLLLIGFLVQLNFLVAYNLLTEKCDPNDPTCVFDPKSEVFGSSYETTPLINERELERPSQPDNENIGDNSKPNNDSQVTSNMPEINTVTIYSTTETPLNVSYSTTSSPFTESPIEAAEISSAGFPEPFPAQYYQSWLISVTNPTAVGIDIIVNVLDLDPATDYLYIRAGNENSTDEKGSMLTGKLDAPKKYKIMKTSAYIEFKSTKNKDQKYKGFSLKHSAYVKNISTIEPPDATTPTPSAKNDDTMTVVLVVPIERKTIETWNQFQVLIVESSNLYVAKYNLPLEYAGPSSIFTSIQNCPNSWINYEACVRVTFAVTLKHNSSQSTDELLESPLKDELSIDNLSKMWSEFGRDAFLNIQIHEYTIPDTDLMLLLWAGIGIVIIFVFLVVLYSIWKMDILRDYHLMSNRADDRKHIISKKSEIDITMFPSPHQIVPTLFPSTNDPIQRMYGDEAQPITFRRSDFPAIRTEPSNSERANERGDGFQSIPKGYTETRLDIDDEEVVTFERKTISRQQSVITQRMVLRGTSNHESMT